YGNLESASELHIVYHIRIRRKVVMTAMLNESDIELMSDWQDEIYTLRARPVTFIYRDKQIDPISGIEIGETEHSREVNAVVTELSSNSDRNIAAGIIYEEGDIKV